ncbi:MAG: hypothetical protein H8D87_00125 [Deltaproteobacteria bacterium]|nr:hypothetical protein [Candidatus Desulfobacula maris]
MTIDSLSISQLRLSDGYVAKESEQNFVSSSDSVENAYILYHGDTYRVNTKQLWFWTDEWQNGERQVDEHIRNGNVQSFDTMDEFLRTLEE